MKTGGRTATCGFESHGFRSERMGSWSNRKTPAPHAGNPGATPGESTHGPVVQRRRRLGHIQEMMVQLHPGSLAACPDTPTGRATRLKPECLQVRLLLWVLTRQRLGRQLADHLGLEPGMLWVRLPPEPLKHVLVEQLGVLATLSRWRPWVQIPSGTLTWHGTQTGKAAKLKPS